MAPPKETPEQQKERWHREVAAYERANDLVTGSAFHTGDKGGPSGGMEWEGRARMAVAKRASGGALDVLDRAALERYPHPGGYVGEHLR